MTQPTPAATSDHDDLWENCRAALQANVPEPAWMTCLRHIHLLNISDSSVLLAVPTTTMRERIHQRFVPTLLAALAEVNISDAELTIEVRDGLPAPADENTAHQTDLIQAFEAAADQERRGAQEEATELLTDSGYGNAARSGHHSTAHPSVVRSAPRPATAPQTTITTDGRYTFDNFVTGSSNRFASAAALSVAESPGNNYNPLFIHGDSGLGKTHLMQSIAHYIHTHLPHNSVRYVTTETFLTEFIEGIRTNTQPAFKRRYRDVDVLLLDDIQIMERKDGLQEELFHTFNDLHTTSRQIVISSDRPPRNIATLSDRMRSRFEWGLVTDILPPDFETRMAILRLKNSDPNIDDSVLEFIAELITDNIRELEGALTRVTALGKLTGKPVTVDIARETLGAMVAAQARAVTPARIIEMTVDRFGYTAAHLKSPSRQRDLVRARHTCMYVMRELTDLSYPAIAEIFGGRDHTTVMHAVKNINDAMQADMALFDQINSLISAVKAA